MQPAYNRCSHSLKSTVSKVTGVVIALVIVSLMSGVATAASVLSVEERAIGVVKGFMHGLETGNAELCMNLLDTPYYQDSGSLTSSAELRILVEKTVRGPKDIGLVEYSIHQDVTKPAQKLDQAYIDVLARSKSDAILFRVKASDVFKIVGLVNAR